MEVERVQDGPLKNSEIARFLEASKTSFKTVDGILSEKKEPMFQQRSLIDIAAEAKSRHSILPETSDHEENTESNPINEDLEVNEENTTEAEKLKHEEEALRLIDEKKIQDAKIEQEKREKEIFEKGYAEGKASAEKETEEKLANGLIALENARKSILDLNASHFIDLREQIASQILKLATERAGHEIKNLPEQFYNKIESLLETIGQATKEPKIFLNGNDLAAIQETISNNKEYIGFNFRSREGLMNGDIVIEIGSISLCDMAFERSEIKDENNSNNYEKESATNNTSDLEVSSPTDHDHDQDHEIGKE